MIGKVLAHYQISEKGARLTFLAAWLKQEGICHPIDLLLAEVYKSVTSEKRQSIQISIADQQQYQRVEAWRPYFERLVAARNTIGEASLVNVGYEKAAIAVAQKKRAAIPVICGSLADRGGPDATTLKFGHESVPIEDLAKISWEHCEVKICFDSDAAPNFQVGKLDS